jgi:hypothetical protein
MAGDHVNAPMTPISTVPAACRSRATARARAQLNSVMSSPVKRALGSSTNAETVCFLLSVQGRHWLFTWTLDLARR